MPAGLDDRDWDQSLYPPRTQFLPPRPIFEAFKNAEYTSRYIEAPDGTRLALDILLPPANPERAARFPCVLHQARYMRGVALRQPLKRLINSKPMGMPGQPTRIVTTVPYHRHHQPRN